MRDSYPARPGHDILYEQLGLPRPEPGPGDGNKITPRAMHRQLYADHQLLVFVQRIASTEPQKRLRPQPVWVSWNAAVRQWWEADMCQTILRWAIRSPISQPDQAHGGSGNWKTVRFGCYRRRDLALFSYDTK